VSSFKTPFRATKICAHFVVWTKVDVYRQFIFLSSPSFVLVCCRADTGKETKVFIICRLTKIECKFIPTPTTSTEQNNCCPRPKFKDRM